MPALSEVQYAAVSAAGIGANTLVAAQAAGVRVRIVGLVLVAAGAVVATVQSGAGGTSITGAMTLAAGTPVAFPFSPGGWGETAAATLLNLNLSAAVQVSGVIAWVAVS